MDATTARAVSSRLAELLSRERVAMADFLVALADFDRRRLWEPLGYPGLWMYLTRELGLSKGTASYRMAAARLVGRFPEVEVALRDGRLCITSVVELARVLTPENRAEVLPRFFHTSKREAKEVSAALLPAATPPLRTVVTAIHDSSSAVAAPPASSRMLPLEPAASIPSAAPDPSALPAESLSPSFALAFGTDAPSSHRVSSPPVLPEEPVRASSTISDGVPVCRRSQRVESSRSPPTSAAFT